MTRIPMQAEEMITGTIEENMAEALKQDRLAEACGPHDPYYRVALMNVEYFLECAALLEKGEKFIPIKAHWHMA